MAFDESAVGNVGSPSTTSKVTVDILEPATGSPLRGELVYLAHPLDNQCLIALGTVTEILTMNRWHEDPNMRGVLKRYGSLPHLSGVGDVRTADVLIQAAYLAADPDPATGDAPMESAGSLSMSPTTGATVSRVTDEFLTNLLRRHKDEITYLGHIYRTDVRMPVTLRHFGSVESGGSGEAYHTGVFGMTGSGKSGLAAYLMAAQLRHPELAVFVIDPQGQFTTEEGLPFSLQQWAEEQGREVLTYSIARDLRLQQNAFLLGDLLGQTRFFKDVLTIRGEDPRESAVAEFVRLLQGVTKWDNEESDALLRTVLTALVGDTQALTRIYASVSPRTRLTGALQSILSDSQQFEIAVNEFGPLHSLFTKKGPGGGTRTSLQWVIDKALDPTATRPFVVIDFSGADADSDLLESASVKAALLRIVCQVLNRRAEEHYKEGKRLNVLVVFDEAHRFATDSPEFDTQRELAERLVDYVRTTRKYGLGWMFITQEIGSLRRGIYTQLRVRCFGYGLTSGTELQRLRETIGDPAALDLYRAFVDPQAMKPAQYPFMLTGPISPLSFTGAPVFLAVFTSFDQFKSANANS
jgi:DNA helicase HerA-like ATPase